MNLHAIAGQYVAVVNPWLLCQLQPSIGYSTNPDGEQVPSYGETTDVLCQAQALTYNDIQQTSSLNIAGVRKAIYIQGEWEGLVRSDKKGGDVITFPDGSVWLVVFVLENWSITAGWTKVCATLQNGS